MNNDEQIPGLLAGRPINWCPGGFGYPPYCPRPTDDDNYVYCCTYGYDIKIPTCCQYPIHTGMFYAMILGTFIFIAVIIFLTCWCWPWCPLAAQVLRVSNKKWKRELQNVYNCPT